MHRTIFSTPGVNTILHTLSRGFLKLTGWTVQGELPPEASRCVVIGAPHTSNWDLPNTLMVGLALRLNLYWMGKRGIFRFPFGALMMWLGGMPVSTDHSTNMVAASVQAVRATTGPLQLAISPEGTRSKTRYWKSGFYYIALGAEVPIALAYMDYERKLAGIGRIFHPTGDYERDMQEIKAFYAPFKGKNPDQFEV